MGKSRNNRFNRTDRYSRRDRFEDGEAQKNDTVWVSLDEIYISDSTWDKLLRRDGQQIDDMRDRFEREFDMVRVVLHHRPGGGYTIEDGRHRVIAAKLADAGFIEAIVIGD